MEILIVEDDSISRNLLKKLLMEMGQKVIEAENGEQAWNILKNRKIKIVISDWMMPGMDGLDLCRKLKKKISREYIYIIMLTAKDGKADLVEVFRAGADDYIAKPFDPEEFNARVMTGIRVINLEERHTRLANTLIESRNKLRIVFDSLREEIVAVNRAMSIVSTNKAFSRNLKSNPQSVVGQNFFEQDRKVAGFFDSEEMQPLVSKVFETGVAQKTLFTAKGDDDRTNYHEIGLLPIQDERNNVFQVVIVCKDITEEKRKSEEIKSLNNQLIATSAMVETQNAELKSTLKRLEETQAQMLQSEKMASIGQLAAGVAHEINNPTGFVSSNLKTLLDYQNDLAELIVKYQDLKSDLQSQSCWQIIPETIKTRVNDVKAFEAEIDLAYLMEDISDLIGDCREGTNRIKKIVTDLKDFAHPGEDIIQTLDINSGLESALNVVNNEIKYKATVLREFEDIPAVKGYPQQLNQVFMNILVNAAQSIEKKGEIVVKTRQVDNQVEIIISDTGCGIAKENLQKIFDPFFTTKDVGKGTGLGMNIAYNIVKKHHGTIDVSSELGKGTVFSIKIPVDNFEAA